MEWFLDSCASLRTHSLPVGPAVRAQCFAEMQCFPHFFEKILSYQTSNSTLLHSQWIPDLSFVLAPQVEKEGWLWHCGVSLCIKYTQLCCSSIGNTQAKCCSQEQRCFVIDAARMRGINLTAAPRANTWQSLVWVSQLDRREINFLTNILFGMTGTTIMAILASCSHAAQQPTEQ